MSEEVIVKHVCNEVEKFNDIHKQIAGVKSDLDEHRAAQQQQTKDRELKDKDLHNKLDNLKTQNDNLIQQMTDLVSLNREVKKIKNAWEIGGNVGYFLVKIILGLTVIFGAIYSLKKWLNN